MKRLILKNLIIISQKNEEARTIEFDEKLNIITGDNPEGETINRTGKSVLIKSIYYALGANLKKYTANWKSLQISTIINFIYDNKQYELYRYKDMFLLKLENGIKFFSSISELREFYVNFYQFYIRMPVTKDDKNVIYAYPGAIFMPFYIDQDKGWSGSWDSFSDVFTGKWKSEILLYHMGIRTKEYYDLLDEKVNLELERKENKRQLNTISTVIKNHFEKYKDYLDINVDLNTFSEEILNLTDEINIQLEKKNKIKEDILECYNSIIELEELYSAAELVYQELLKDVDYVETDLTDEEILCPICGTVHKNSVENKFHIYSDIEECEQVMQAYYEERSKIEKKLRVQQEELQGLDDYIEIINEILNRKREKITFKEVMIAEGSKSILDDMRKERDKLNNRYLFIEDRIQSITNEQTAISRQGSFIIKDYLQKLSIALSVLNVTDMDSKELDKFKSSFDSGGNDLPCAILAQVYSLYSVASNHSKSVCAPIVLDAIFQQEPAEEKINKIWDYVISQQPQNSQLILSTTDIHNREFDGKIIRLTEEKGLLRTQDYILEKDKINWYKESILTEMKKIEKLKEINE